MKLTINLTPKDLSEGLPNNAYNCPLALAISRTKQAKNKGVIVGTTGFFIGDREYCSPEFLRNFVMSLDSGKKVKPFRKTFNI